MKATVVVLAGLAADQVLPAVAEAFLLWVSRNPQKAEQLAQEAVQASSGNPTSPTGTLTAAQVGVAPEGTVAAITAAELYVKQ